MVGTCICLSAQSDVSRERLPNISGGSIGGEVIEEAFPGAVKKEIQTPEVRKRRHQPHLSFLAFVSRKPTISQSSPSPPTTFNKLQFPSHGPESGDKALRDAKKGGKIDNGNFSNIKTHHLGGGQEVPSDSVGFGGNKNKLLEDIFIL